MKKILALLLLLLLLVTPALADGSRVIDDADVLSVSEEASLEQAISLIREKYQFDVVLLTKTSIDGKVPRYYAADYYDYGGFGYGDTHDGIILLLVTGAGVGNRDYTIVNTGRGEKIFDEYAMEELEEAMLPSLRASDFAAGMASFVSGVEEQLDYMTPKSRTERWGLLSFVVGLVIGTIVALIFRGQMKTVRRKVNAQSYIRDGSFQLNRVQDIYLYTTTTRRKIETSSSGGGSGGFTGSSGTHHTSHSGKF
ncbi:MAG: TPM domain-containing protein [Clostridia bacterium]|nr:TPM domain-containing protein [Clostridia bacterium]